MLLTLFLRLFVELKINQQVLCQKFTYYLKPVITKYLPKLNFFLNCCFTTMWSWERLFGFENKIIVESFPISCKSATLSRLGLPPALASCTVSSLKSPNLLNVRRELQQKTFFLTSFIFSGECFKDLVATSFKKVSFQIWKQNAPYVASQRSSLRGHPFNLSCKFFCSYLQLWNCNP